MKGYKYLKLRLIPTKKQEEIMWKHVNHSRGFRNILVAEGERILNSKEGFLSSNYFYDYLKLLLSKKEYSWLREISKYSLSQVCRKLYSNYKMCFDKKSGRPKYSKKNISTDYYYVRSDGKDKFYLDSNNNLKIEKLGRVKVSKGSLKSNLYKINTIQNNDRLRESVIKHDGKYWYISIAYVVSSLNENQVTELTNEVIGIDLGIKTLATCSNGKSYKNINKSSKVRKLEKQLKRKQRQVSRKYEMNKDKLRIYHLDKEGKPVKTKSGMYKTSLLKTKNIIKLEKEIKLLHRRLKNIRNTYIHTLTKEIVEQYPQEIVIEDLKVSNMLKNKYLAPNISKCNWYEIRKLLGHKCEDRGILLTVANTYYPSSQTCSNCGNCLTKQDKLSLKERTYKCKKCNSSLDRDLNASLNLMNYRYSNWYQNYIDSK